ncbi:hypothetical protein D3093_32315 (plasmid) [Azospirillum argentinense]|uniref:Fatty acid desaturase domain-containing protein n=1 Tax=Azospirillum argentinense TaxID=2970906 RepID=A0A4D8Q0A3_9PROT|nr:fatty acid desaturase [Azospirillum argentinense]QCN99921.1 hypothetical protein D3093_32315 [Azospirillum argentinense]
MSAINRAAEIRADIRRALPREAFQRTPARAWLILLFNTVIAGCMVVVLAYDLAWYWMLLVALILGHHFFAMGIMSHDIMHGATLKNRSLRRLVSYFGFYPFLISPRLWDVWHNKAHHGRTNTTHDPDANLTVAEAERNAIARFGVHLMPSSRNRILGIVFYTYWFTLVGQVILWAGHRFKEWNIGDYSVDLGKARLETVGYYLLWAVLAYHAGPFKSLFIIVIPMMIGNIVFMSFASSQHVFLPQTEDNDPLMNSASVRVPAWVDALTLNFSHHVEHHLFPAMSYAHTPKVRAWLRENLPGTYMELSFRDTFRLVFHTPRLYGTPNLLRHSDEEESQAIDTTRIRDALRNGESIESADFRIRYAATP